MRKVFILLIVIIFINLSASVFAQNYYYFVWENTYIDINVGDALEDYIHLPKATLYINDKPSDENVVYLRGDNSTDEALIDTSKVGVYYLTYTAISSIEAQTLVTFNVRDIKGPEIKNITPLIFNVGQEVNYQNYFIFNDYSTNINVVYNDGLILYDKPGLYTLTVSATDEYGNNTSLDFFVTINDAGGPRIEIIKELNIGYNELFEPLNYFRAIDDTDGDVSSSLIASVLDTSVLGPKTISIKAYDYSNNMTLYTCVVNVIDTLSPKINLTNKVINLGIGELLNINEAYFLSYIDNVYDDCDDLSLDDVLINLDDLEKNIGSYKVSYYLEDESGNSVKELLIVNVICDSVPIITTNDIHIKVGDSINYYHYISVYDKYDGDITLEANIDSSSVNTNKKGIYFASVVVKNSYGKYSQATITVYVKKSFIREYYWIFLIGAGVVLVIVFIVKYKKKNDFTKI